MGHDKVGAFVMSSKSIAKTDTWLEKITKLVPVEATGVFVALQSYIGASALQQPTKEAYMLTSLGVCGLLAILFLYKVYDVRNLRHHAVSVLALVIWAFNVNPDAFGSFTAFPTQERLIAPLVLIVFSAVAPLFVPPLPAPPGKPSEPVVGGTPAGALNQEGAGS